MQGQHFVVPSRLRVSAPKEDAAMHEIREATAGERLAFYLADFCSFAQVRTLAESESSGHAPAPATVKIRASPSRGRPRAW